jgi:hypothetical protein
MVARDTYTHIYAEYVRGPVRGRKGGTYGGRPGQPYTIHHPATAHETTQQPSTSSLL